MKHNLGPIGQSESNHIFRPRLSEARRIRKFNFLIMGIKSVIEKGGRASALGCKDPQPILDRLKALGVNAKAEPMIVTQPLKAIWETDGYEEYISGFADGEKKQTGFTFFL